MDTYCYRCGNRWIHKLSGTRRFGNLESTGDYFTAFGIGATAGAAGAGVGSGISSVLAGTSFWAGFVGSQAAAVACPSFATGITVTSTSAFSTTFLNNFGNGLAFEDKNFGEALWSGFWKGLVSAGIAGITGGITSGIIAYRNGTGFWDGFDYKATLYRYLDEERANRSDSRWMIANKKTARYLNRIFNIKETPFIYQDGMLMRGKEAFPEGVNIGIRDKTRKMNISIVSKKTLRDPSGLTNVIRHEYNHQLETIYTSRPRDIRYSELSAYIQNIVNSTSNASAQKAIDTLINEWGFTMKEIINAIANGIPYY